MKLIPTFTIIAASTGAAVAQVVEIPVITIPAVSVDMDNVNGGAPGVTTLQAIRNAGGGAVAEIAAITLIPSPTAADGFYNFNTEGGNGLARSASNGLELRVPFTGAVGEVAAAATFRAFEATIDFEVQATEFGFSVGDWSGGMVIEFRRAADNSLVDMHSSSEYETTDTKFFRTLTAFDRIVLRPDAPDGNWLLTEIVVPSTPPWTSFGTGCPGSAGTPLLSVVSNPAINAVFSLSVTNMPSAGGFFVVTLGFSTTADPILGPLPIDLGPLGAPGCSILTSIEDTAFQIHSSGSGGYSLTIPNDLAFIGVRITNQAFVQDTVNAFGAVVSNAGVGVIQANP